MTKLVKVLCFEGLNFRIGLKEFLDPIRKEISVNMLGRWLNGTYIWVLFHVINLDVTVLCSRREVQGFEFWHLNT